MWKVITLILWLTVLDIQPTTDDFVPKDISKAVAMGCLVRGDAGPPPFAETQVFVKWTVDSPKFWDFKPVMSRRDDIFKAIDDCREWLDKVKTTIAKSTASK